MLWRCSPANKRDAKYYRHRGINVCKRWQGPRGFINFLRDMGLKPAGMQIDRRNPNGDYKPSNVRWVTPMQQVHNRRYNPQSVKTHCPHGHPYAGANLGYYKNRGWRRCRQCHRELETRRRQRRKQLGV